MMAKLLSVAKKLVSPDAKERKRVAQIVKEIKTKFSEAAKKANIDAKLVPGGSVAKGTWLPKLSDIDFFVVFDYEKYAERSSELSFLTEKVLRTIWQKIIRLKGSRDYFSVKYKGFNLEFVPVLDISKGGEAKNITDYSPLHVAYVKKAKCKTDIRLAKQFMKAAKVYGAESYVGGFSGHLADLLVIYYGSFLNLIKAAANWPDKVFIDPAKHYKDEKEALQSISKEKILGPLILIDPIEKDRNAAAALTFEKFDIFRKAAKEFLERPSLDFFKIKKLSISEIKANAGNNKVIIFECATPVGKKDVVGAKIKKIFENLRKDFTREDFEILDCGWEMNSKSYFWFYFPKKDLDKVKIHFGPPKSAPEEHIKKFKQKWKSAKLMENKWTVELKRKFIKPEDLAKLLAKKYKLKWID